MKSLKITKVVLGIVLSACADGALPKTDQEGDAAPAAEARADAFRAPEVADGMVAREPLTLDAGGPGEGPGDVDRRCETGDACPSGYCVEDPTGRRVCTRLCSTIPDDCPPGWACAAIGNNGVDRTFVCLVRPHDLCRPCESDATCPGANARCLQIGSGRFCGADCARDGFCPEGYECRSIELEGEADGAAVEQCHPVSENGCLTCVDADGDGYGAGEECAGTDCDDGAVGVHLGAVERCDGVDNDCDGAVDGPSVDAADRPDCARGGICADATAHCVAGTWQCDNGPLWEASEATCDGLDNDCNGRVDDVEGMGGGCEAGIGPCARPGVLRCDVALGMLACSAVPGAPQAETCDGIDNDCDGTADELAGVGEACIIGEGLCAAAGQTVCDAGAGRLRCDARPGMPQPERCDGLDNNCDGEVDEGIRNACGGCGPAPEEVCNGVDDDCDDAIDEENACEVCVARNEICNGQDDDCVDGVDNGVLNACGRCGAVPVEACNGMDDDCDGRVDEGVLNACGACGQVPAERCNEVDDDCDGLVDEEAECESEVCDPQAVEICNRLDDDCDGLTDEGGLLNACGDCGPEPTEQCNDTDDDCDGSTDEGLLNACGSCGPAPVEVCNGMDDDCDRAVDEGLLNACGRCGAVPVEVCNGEDDNCDGLVDEGVSNACGRCGAVPAEVCDGEDNNCNGQIDEGVQNACGRCGALPVEVCDNVDNNCNGQIDEGVRNRCGACGQEPPEVCDNLDNNCNGQIDEGVQNACGRCGAVPVEVCDNVDNNCNGQIDEGVQNACGRCGAVPVEVCDNVDNNCNGQVDEGVQNACGRCGAVPAEVCDNVDNNCNGQTDECPAGQACQGGRCAAVCNAASYWSPASMTACGTTIGITLCMEVRARAADDELETRVCSQGNFVNAIRLRLVDMLGWHPAGFDGVLNGIGQLCTPWGRAGAGSFNEGERFGGPARIISPADCSDEWDDRNGGVNSYAGCNAPAPDPGCGSCWHIDSNVMTRTCRQ